MNKFFLLIILFLFVMFLGCKENTNEPINIKYSGITKTGANNPNPIGDIDLDDWKSLPEVGAEVFPAYPNPTNGYTRFQFKCTDNDSVIVALDDPVENKYSIVYSKKIIAGYYSLDLSLTYGAITQQRKDGIVRLFFTVVRNGKNYKTYGDIEFKWK